MPIKIITEPAIEPVTLAEAKAHLGLSADFTADDEMLERLIQTAREGGEHRTGRAFVETAFEVAFDSFQDVMEMPKAPFRELVSITYLDADGAEQTLDSSIYYLDDYSLIARVMRVTGQDWPTTAERVNAVRIRFKAGWPVTASSPAEATTPEAIKTWMLVKVASQYEQREDFITGTIKTDMDRHHTDGLLDPYVIPVVV